MCVTPPRHETSQSSITTLGPLRIPLRRLGGSDGVSHLESERRTAAMRAPLSSCQPTTCSVGSNRMLQRCVTKIMGRTNVSEVEARQAIEQRVVKKAWNNDLTKPPTVQLSRRIRSPQLFAASPHACRDSAAWSSPPLPRWLPPQPQRPPQPLNTHPSGGLPRGLMAVTLRPGQSSIVDLRSQCTDGLLLLSTTASFVPRAQAQAAC